MKLSVTNGQNWTLDNNYNYMYKVKNSKLFATSEHIVVEEQPRVDDANCTWYGCQKKW